MNAGKKFENIFKKSIPSYCMVHRLKDSAQSYNNSENTKFSWNNPCDFFVFSSKQHLLYTLELKSTKQKSISFQRDKDDKISRMIPYHQIQSLEKMSKYDGIISGFIFNFRDTKKDIERTYFQNIMDFKRMIQFTTKNSINEVDLNFNNAIKIEGIKVRVNYTWNLDSLFS